MSQLSSDYANYADLHRRLTLTGEYLPGEASPILLPTLPNQKRNDHQQGNRYDDPGSSSDDFDR